MFHLFLPSDDSIRATLRGLADVDFTYADVGATREPLSAAPRGFVLDRYGAEIGRGRETFERARAALSELRNYPPSFTRVVRDAGELEPGATFATVARHLGFASVHPCRVIYVIREADRFGLGFGTLPGHGESGEERFVVSVEGEVVRYDVQAFSRPHDLLARLGAPITRYYQRRFQRETVDVMREHGRAMLREP